MTRSHFVAAIEARQTCPPREEVEEQRRRGEEGREALTGGPAPSVKGRRRKGREVKKSGRFWPSEPELAFKAQAEPTAS